MEYILELKNATVAYHGVSALQNVSMAFKKGSISAIMGPNGAGKSTAIKALYGIAPLSQGKVIYKDEKIEPIVSQMIGMGMVLVPQGRRVFSHLTVEQNIMLGMHALKIPKKDKIERVAKIINFFPLLREKINAHAWELSGGTQQLLAMARGLASKPEILLLDEPTLGLSPLTVKEIFSHIKRINTEFGTTIVIVEHNISSLLPMSKQTFVLDCGKLIFAGSPQELIEMNILEKTFTGLPVDKL